MDFLVLRNEKGKTVEVIAFDSIVEAKAKRTALRESGHQGELILCFAENLRALFLIYPEYRPEHWKELLDNIELES